MNVSRRKVLATASAAPFIASFGYHAAAAAPALKKAAVEKLRSSLQGRLYLPESADYPRINRGDGVAPVDGKHPALIVQPMNAQDISRAIIFAREAGLPIGVRSGGHDALGASTTVDGLQIDLALMNGVEIFATNGTGHIQTGARSGVLNAAAQKHDLAAALGMMGHVGIGGVTLGGGIGWLCGRDGATVDNLLAAEVVTADGKVLTTSAEENPDLFWAIRGGGGNFGVASNFTFRLRKVGTVLGGTVACKTDAAKFMRFFGDYLKASPDHLDTALILVPGGRVAVRVCWSGDVEEGERILRPLRNYATPLADAIKVMPYEGFIEAPTAAPMYGNHHTRSGALGLLNDKVIPTLARLADSAPEGVGTIGLMHYMHGAMCRVDQNATPFIRQEGNILYAATTSWEGPVHPEDKKTWVQKTYEEIRKVARAQTYINYLSEDDEKWVRNAYGPHYAKLQKLKRTYDPTNVFRGNRNIRV